LGVLDEVLQKQENAITEEAINVAILNHIVRHLTSLEGDISY